MSITANSIKVIIKNSEIGKKINIEDLDDTKNLYDQGLDSLDLMTILLIIEEEFNVHIPDEDIEGLKTLNDIANYVNNKLSK